MRYFVRVRRCEPCDGITTLSLPRDGVFYGSDVLLQELPCELAAMCCGRRCPHVVLGGIESSFFSPQTGSAAMLTAAAPDSRQARHRQVATRARTSGPKKTWAMSRVIRPAFHVG
jgi:hypothetical protein